MPRKVNGGKLAFLALFAIGLVVLVVVSLIAQPSSSPVEELVAPSTRSSNARKTGGAGFDLETCGCPTQFSTPVCSGIYNHAFVTPINYATSTNNSNGGQRVTASATWLRTGILAMRGRATLVVTNDGDRNAVLRSIYVGLEESAPRAGNAPGPSGDNWRIVSSDAQWLSSTTDFICLAIVEHCRQGVTTVPTALPQVPYTPMKNSLRIFPEVPSIAPTPRRCNNRTANEALDWGSDGCGGGNGIDDDGDGHIDEDGYCCNARQITVDYELELTREQADGLLGKSLRINILATYTGASASQGNSCPLNTQCYDVAPGENGLARTVQTRMPFVLTEPCDDRCKCLLSTRTESVFNSNLSSITTTPVDCGSSGVVGTSLDIPCQSGTVTTESELVRDRGCPISPDMTTRANTTVTCNNAPNVSLPELGLLCTFTGSETFRISDTCTDLASCQRSELATAPPRCYIEQCILPQFIFADTVNAPVLLVNAFFETNAEATPPVIVGVSARNISAFFDVFVRFGETNIGFAPAMPFAPNVAASLIFGPSNETVQTQLGAIGAELATIAMSSFLNTETPEATEAFLRLVVDDCGGTMPSAFRGKHVFPLLRTVLWFVQQTNTSLAASQALPNFGLPPGSELFVSELYQVYNGDVQQIYRDILRFVRLFNVEFNRCSRRSQQPIICFRLSEQA